MRARVYKENFIETAQGILTPAPLVLAEQLSSDQVWALNQDPARRSPLDLHFQQGSANLEWAFCLPRLHSRRKALDRAQAIFTDIYQRDSAYQQKAGIFLDYMPAFSPRMERTPYAPELFRRLCESLGARALGLAGSRNWGLFYEATFLGICASIGDLDYLTFPASVREEAASPRAANYNHDAYGIRHTTEKMPLQLKSAGGNDRKRYESMVGKVNVRSLIAKSAVAIYGEKRWQAKQRPSSRQVYTMPADRMAELFQLTSRLMIADAQCQPLHEQNAAYLEELKSKARLRIDQLWQSYPPQFEAT